jgi:hypothetical protein
MWIGRESYVPQTATKEIIKEVRIPTSEKIDGNIIDIPADEPAPVNIEETTADADSHEQEDEIPEAIQSQFDKFERSMAGESEPSQSSEDLPTSVPEEAPPEEPPEAPPEEDLQ